MVENHLKVAHAPAILTLATKLRYLQTGLDLPAPRILLAVDLGRDLFNLQS